VRRSWGCLRADNLCQRRCVGITLIKWQLTADVAARARVRVTSRRAKVDLPAVTLIDDEVRVTVRRLALDDRLRVVDRTGGDDTSKRDERDERRDGEVHDGQV